MSQEQGPRPEGPLAELKMAQAALEDLEEERRFTLGQTGVHLGAQRVRSLRAAWDREEARLRQQIAALKAQLEGMASDAPGHS